MKKLLFILFAAIAVTSCNEGETGEFQNCIERYSNQYDTVHVQSAPNASQDLYNLGYDTTKALVILPVGMQ